MSRNYTCSVGWLATVGFLCAVLLAPEQSAACSCLCYYEAYGYGFVNGGDLIPSNSRGLLWWGKFDGSNGTAQDLPVQIASASGESLLVEYELVDQNWGLWLFRPRGGFEIRKSYVFTTKRTCLKGLIEDEEQRISVTVSDQAVVPPAGPVALKISESITDALSQSITGALMIAAGVSCSRMVNAAQLHIELDLPEAMRAFSDQLYFETIIDGTDSWKPSASICSPVLPGASWQGKGGDLLFSICDDTPAIAQEGLAAGRHTVEMRASLPGTDVLAASSKVEVDLWCPKERAEKP
jgi:hypothetical protein